MRRTKLYSIIAAAMLLGLVVVPQMVTANIEPLRASDYINTYKVTAHPLNYGQIRFDFQVTGVSLMTQLGVSQIQILEKTGTTWATVATYRYQDYPILMGYNTSRHSGSITFPGITGRTYMAYVTFYAANASGSESQELHIPAFTAK